MDVPFYKAGSSKMVITSQDYKFHGTTYAPVVKECYVLNEEGTAFEYVASKTLDALSSYFSTTLPEELRLPSIVLPDIPVAPIKTNGDINGDAKVDIADAVNVLNLMAGGAFNALADINGDGVVDIADFVSILNLMAGSDTPEPDAE